MAENAIASIGIEPRTTRAQDEILDISLLL